MTSTQVVVIVKHISISPLSTRHVAAQTFQWLLNVCPSAERRRIIVDASVVPALAGP